MPAAVPDHIISRLFLRAVLPTLAAFVERDETARRTIEGWRFAVRFSTASGVGTTLTVRNGAVAVDEPPPGFTLRLFFLGDRDLVRAFRREGLPRVLPWGGLHHLARLPAFLDLLGRMEEALGAPAGESAGGARRELRVELLLGTLIPAAVAELGACDRECRRLLAPFGDFAVQLSVSGVIGGWIARRGERLVWGRGQPPSPPDVRIGFRDSGVAQAAIDGLIDQLAAIVTGEMSVQGMIPLAEAFTRIMERVSACLDPRRFPPAS